jgi:hypothetical protein
MTLDLGLRYFYFSPDSVSGDQVSNFDASTFHPAAAPVVTTGGIFKVDANNVAVEPGRATGESYDGLVFAGKNGFTSIGSQAFVGTSNYNSLQTGFVYRMNPIQINVAYTLQLSCLLNVQFTYREWHFLIATQSLTHPLKVKLGF